MAVATQSAQRSSGRAPLPLAALSVLAAAVFAANTTEVLPVGLLPIISHDLGTSESRTGLLISAYAVVVAVTSIPLTALVARWPRRQVLVVLLAGYALSNAVLAGTDDYWVAFGARMLGGLAHAGFFSVVFAAAISLVPPDRAGRAVAFVGAGAALALALGVPLGTALGTAIGWRWAFVGFTAVLVGLTALTARVLPAGQSPPAAAGHVPVLTAVRGRALLMMAAVIVVLTLGHYTPFTYISLLILRAGIGRGAVSLVLLGYGAASVLGLAVAGAVVDRHPRRGLQLAIAATAGCLLCLGLIHTTAATVALVAVWGLLFGMLPTLVQAVTLRAVPHAPDAAPAVVNAGFNTGIAGGAVLGAQELFVTGPATLALTGAALAGSALLLLTAAARGHNRR